MPQKKKAAGKKKPTPPAAEEEETEEEEFEEIEELNSSMGGLRLDDIWYHINHDDHIFA